MDEARIVDIALVVVGFTLLVGLLMAYSGIRKLEERLETLDHRQPYQPQLPNPADANSTTRPTP